MNRRLFIGLMLFAWCLYVASLFLPAADIDVNSSTGFTSTGFTRGGDLEMGLEIFKQVLNPLYWIFFVPIPFSIANYCFLFSPVILERRLRDPQPGIYTPLISFSAVVSWIAPGAVGDVGVGYFAWTAAITLVAVATCIPLNRVQSQVMLDSDGTDKPLAV